MNPENESRFPTGDQKEPNTEALVGRCAVPVSGQDQGRVFLIVGVTGEGLLLLSDGKRRRLNHPKKKKLIHVTVLPESIRKADIPETGDTLTDAEIRRITADYRRSTEQPETK